MKEKMKSYSFWMSVTGAVVLLLNNLGKIFGFAVSSEQVVSVVDGICGILVIFGILTMPKKGERTISSLADEKTTDVIDISPKENEKANTDVTEKTDDNQIAVKNPNKVSTKTDEKGELIQ